MLFIPVNLPIHLFIKLLLYLDRRNLSQHSTAGITLEMSLISHLRPRCAHTPFVRTHAHPHTLTQASTTAVRVFCSWMACLLQKLSALHAATKSFVPPTKSLYGLFKQELPPHTHAQTHEETHRHTCTDRQIHTHALPLKWKPTVSLLRGAINAL